MESPNPTTPPSPTATPHTTNEIPAMWSKDQHLAHIPPISPQESDALEHESLQASKRLSITTTSTTSEAVDHIVEETGGSSSQHLSTKRRSCVPPLFPPPQTIVAAASVHLTSQMGEPTWLLVVPPKKKISIGSLFRIEMVDGRSSRFTFRARARDEDLHDRIVIRASPTNAETPKDILLIIEDRWFQKQMTEIIAEWWSQHQ